MLIAAVGQEMVLLLAKEKSPEGFCRSKLKKMAFKLDVFLEKEGE